MGIGGCLDDSPLFDYRAVCPQLREKSGQHFTAFGLKNAFRYLYLMIKRVHLKKIYDRARAAGFRTHASCYKPVEPGLDDRSGAHLAGL